MAASTERSVEMARRMATVWRLGRARPELLAAHAAAYAALAQDGAAASTRLLGRRALLLGLCVGGLLVGTTLLGVALILWVSVPFGTPAQIGVLLAVPALPLLLATWAAWAWRHAGPWPLWAALEVQAARDLTLLRAHDS